MPLPPTSGTSGAPSTVSLDLPFPAAATAVDLNTPLVVVDRTGYVTKARILPDAAYTGAATNYRQWTLVDGTTRAVSDGVTTSGSPNISSATAAWTQDDVGKAISGTGIPASTTILSITQNAPGGSTVIKMDKNATATGTSITFTIGSSRIIATLDGVGGQNLATGTPKALVLSTTDTRVFAGDELVLNSTHQGTGLADPGGTLDLEITAYAEGGD